MNRVETFLQHYADQPYDPVKAHEYYIKNRQLKGRTTSGMSEQQKEAWIYTKDQITTDKKKKLELAKLENTKKIEELKVNAEETRARISEKLKALSKKLADDAEVERKKIADKVKADIANLPPIPDNISATQRSILVAKRNKEIDAIRSKSSSDLSKLTEDVASSRETSTSDIAKERKKVGTDLKEILNTTRASYDEAKTNVIAEYEDVYQKEYSEVLSTVAGKAKPKSKAKSKSKSKGKGKTKKDIEGGFYYKRERKL